MCENNTGERFHLIAFDRSEAKLKLTGRKIKQSNVTRTELEITLIWE